jgi:hypothetical protein
MRPREKTKPADQASSYGILNLKRGRQSKTPNTGHIKVPVYIGHNLIFLFYL